MRDLKYIIKRVIIGLLIGIGILFFKNNVSFAMTYDCGGSFKLNGQTLSTETTKTISAGTNYTFSVENLSVGVDYAASGDLFYTDVEFLSNLAFGDYTGSSNGVTFQIMRTGLQAPGLFDGQKDGVIRVRYLWQSNDVLGQQFPTMRRMGTVFNYGGSVNYLGGIRIKSITCGYQSEMPSLDEYSMEQINQLNAIKGSLDNLRTGIETANTLHQQELEKLTELGRKMEKVDETMKDDSIDDAPSQFSEFDDYLAQNGVITNLVTMPVTLFTKILNTLNGTCANYNLGNLYGTDLTLPCINISNYLGAPLWSVIDVIISGLLVYAISRHFIKMFNKMSSLEESDIID